MSRGRVRSHVALPVVPAEGDIVTVEYRSRQTKLKDGGDGLEYPSLQETTGEVELAKEYKPTKRDDGMGRVFVVRNRPDRLVVADVRPSGKGGKCYSVNFQNEGKVVSFRARHYGAWTLEYTGDKTNRMELGRVEAIRLVEAAPSDR